MTNSGDKLSAVFRSLGADDTGFKQTAKTAADQAQQRWPLLMALEPKPAPLPPALSDEERARWQNQESPKLGKLKPVLPKLDAGDSMTLSLQVMSPSQRKPKDPATQPPVPPAPALSNRTSVTKSVAVADASPMPAAKPMTKRRKSAKPADTENPTNSLVGELGENPSAALPEPASGLVRRRNTAPVAPVAPEKALFDVPQDHSLTGIFARLDAPALANPQPKDCRTLTSGRTRKA